MWEKTPPVNALAHVGKRVVFRKPNMVEIEEFEIHSSKLCLILLSTSPNIQVILMPVL